MGPLGRFFSVGLLSLSLAGCALLTPLPEPTSRADRLAAFPTEGLPLDGSVRIYWNEASIPYIAADSDADGAFALGLVHAHLRLAQMEIFKRIAYGRLAEMIGPPGVEIDRALRTIDLPRAVPAQLAAMPPETRDWLDRFVAGINHYAESLEPSDLPHEFRVLGMEREPWTAADTLAVGRLSGVDVNWFAYAALLPIAKEAGWDQLLNYSRAVSATGEVSFQDRRTAGRSPFQRTASLLNALSRSGSNSVVVAPERSASGGGLIANDPHLGFLLPNAWLITGLETPGMKLVGMMIPGVPTFAFGRSEHLAWGGTNLRALQSDLVDVSALPDDAFSSRTHDIDVRFWFDTTHETQSSPYGPIISDVSILGFDLEKTVALRWLGHQSSDELSALLAAARARSVEEFRQSLAAFSVPGQNFLAVDRAGSISHVLATGLPGRTDKDLEALVTSPAVSDRAWQDLKSVLDLPYALDPPEGYIASANNRPTESLVPVGRYFPQDERIRRLKDIFDGERNLTPARLAAIQTDSLSPLSAETNAAILAAIRAAGITGETEPERAVLAALTDWDGSYAVASREAVAFEALLQAVGLAVLEADGLGFAADAFSSGGLFRKYLIDRLAEMDESVTRPILALGLAEAAGTWESEQTWGDIHRLPVQHILGNLPVLGGRYRIEDLAVPGSRETVWKTAHDLTTDVHDSFYGAQARHISDLADPGENYFVLFGGQDGWVNSENFADQVPLWRSGSLIRVPLGEAAVAEAFGAPMQLGR